MAKEVGAEPSPWGRGQGGGGVAGAAGCGQVCGSRAKSVGALPRPWRRCQGNGGVAKAVEV